MSEHEINNQIEWMWDRFFSYLIDSYKAENENWNMNFSNFIKRVEKSFDNNFREAYETARSEEKKKIKTCVCPIDQCACLFYDKAIGECLAHQTEKYCEYYQKANILKTNKH